MRSPDAYLMVCFFLVCSVARGDFELVIDVPPETSPASIGNNTQLNLSDPGSIPDNFTAGAADGSSTNVEVNITGGTVGHHFFSYAGSIVNVSGGNFSHRFWTHGGSISNISGGIFGPDVTCDGNSLVNISGGQFDHEVHALFRSTVNVWGGNIGFFQAHSESRASFFGREFYLDGVEMTQLIPGQPFTIPDRDVPFSGILADGSPFSFMLISEHPDQQGPDVDHFDVAAILTVTLLHAADFDSDGDVDEMDLARWEASYGVDDLADADGDGDSDGDDFLAWQSQYTGPLDAFAATIPVPEPQAAVLLLVAGMCAMSQRRRRI